MLVTAALLATRHTHYNKALTQIWRARSLPSERHNGASPVVATLMHSVAHLFWGVRGLPQFLCAQNVMAEFPSIESFEATDARPNVKPFRELPTGDVFKLDLDKCVTMSVPGLTPKQGWIMSATNRGGECIGSFYMPSTFDRHVKMSNLKPDQGLWIMNRGKKPSPDGKFEYWDYSLRQLSGQGAPTG